MTRQCELGMEIVENGNDLEDTKAAFGEDEKSRLELEKGCSLKTQEWEEIKKTIAEELVALADAFQVLNERSPTGISTPGHV